MVFKEIFFEGFILQFRRKFIPEFRGEKGMLIYIRLLME